MEVSAAATASVVLPLLILHVLSGTQPADALILKSIWQRLASNAANNNAATTQPEVIRQDDIPHLDDYIRQDDILHKDNILHQNNILGLEDSDQQDFNKRSLLVDGTSLDFVYWNSEFGNNKSMIIEFNNEKKIINSWLQGKPLKVITHGWLASDDDDGGVFAIKAAYVIAKEVNVITVDWNRVSSNYMYPMPAYLTAEVGSIIAKLLENLVNLAVIDPSDIHVIGHSLGAHVSGACGAAFSLGKIGRITGLDPAGPGFEYVALRSDRLDSTDAQFVDVIHSAVGAAGYAAPLGHADFYPNSGKPPQPGCFESYMPSAFVNVIGCSHSRSHILFTESVYNTNSFRSVKCSSWEEFTSGACKNNEKTQMGNDADSKARGVFYLKTNDKSPYSISDIVTSKL